MGVLLVYLYLSQENSRSYSNIFKWEHNLCLNAGPWSSGYDSALTFRKDK
jgi:hypothetical protein